MPNTVGNDAPYLIGAIEDAATAEYPGLKYANHVPGFGPDTINPVVANDDGTFLAAFQVSAPVYLQDFFSQSSNIGTAGFGFSSGVVKEYQFHSITPDSSGIVTYTLSGVDAANQPLQIALPLAEDGRIVITETILANFALGSSPRLQLSGLAPNSQYSGYFVLENADAFDSAAPTTTVEAVGSFGILSLVPSPAGQSSLQSGNFIKSPVGLVESFSLTNTTAWASSATTFKLVLHTQEPLDLTGFSGVILQDGSRWGGNHPTVLLVTPVDGVIAVPPTILQQLEARPGSVSLFVSGFVLGGQPPQAQMAVQFPVTTIDEGLYVQHFDASGTPLAKAVRVDEAANAIVGDTGSVGFTVSRSADGSMVAAWLGDTANAADAVYVRKLDDTGNPMGDAVTLSGVDSVALDLLAHGNGSAVLTGLADSGFAIAYTVEPWFSHIFLRGETSSGSLNLSGIDGKLEQVYLHQFVAAGAITAQVRGEAANGSALSVNVSIADGRFQMTDAVRGQFAPDSHLSLFIGGLTPNTDYVANVATRDVFEFDDTSALGTVSRSANAGNATGASPDIYFSTGQGETLSFKVIAATAEAGSAPAYTISLITTIPLDLTGLTQYTGPSVQGQMASTANTSIGFNVFLNTIVVTPVEGTVTVPEAILSQIDDDSFRSILGISGLASGTAVKVDIGIRHPSHISVPGLYIQTFDANGEAATAAQRVDDADAGLPIAAPLDDDAVLGISANADGGFRVTWLTTADIEGALGRLISREFNADGVAVGPAIDLSAAAIPGVVAANLAGGDVSVPDLLNLVELGNGGFATLLQIDAEKVFADLNAFALAPAGRPGTVGFSPLQGQLDSVEVDVSNSVGAALAAEPRAGYVAGKGLDGNALQVPVMMIDGRFKMTEDIRVQFAPDERLILYITGVINPDSAPNTTSFVFIPAVIGSRDIFSFDESSSKLSINSVSNAGSSASSSDAFIGGSVGQTVAFQINELTPGSSQTPDFALYVSADYRIDPAGLPIYSGANSPPFHSTTPNVHDANGLFSTTIAVTPTNGRIEVPQALLDQFPNGGLNIVLHIRGLQADTPVNVDTVVRLPSQILDTGLFVQLFDNAGVATGELIRIDDPATSVAVVDEDYSQSSIQSDGAGGFRVVWKSDVDGDGDADGINIRHFNSSGVQIGDTTSIGSIPDRIYDEREAVTLYTSGLFADPDPGDVLTFSAVGLPDGLHINSATGVITGAATDLGLFAITVRATDSGGLFASTDFDILILNDVTEPSVRFADPGAILVSNFAVGAGGWSSQDLYPRHIADVNGDGRSDIVGFGQAGVLVSFGAANGTFSNAGLVVSNFGQASGWSSDNSFHRELADVNGDGRADIVGFGIAGTLVSLAKADGTFSNPGTGVANFGANQGWSTQNAFARTVGDVNGDGKADLIGFGYAGTLVSLGNGDGTFKPASVAVANFGVDQGWTSDNLFHRTVADVNGDGADDIVGFGYDGTLVALSNGDGTFGGAKLVLNNFGKNQGWASQDAFTRDVADVNNDGRADIVGFGTAGTYVAYGRLDGTFSPASRDVDNFGTDQGWISDATYHREIADINNDGLNDIVGFGYAGVFASLNQGDELLI